MSIIDPICKSSYSRSLWKKMIVSKSWKFSGRRCRFMV